jgi:hypothetical protein
MSEIGAETSATFPDMINDGVWGVASGVLGEGTPENWPLNVNSGGTALLLVKTGPGHFEGFTAYNGNAATRYVQVFFGTATPIGGSVPNLVWQVPSGNTVAVEFTTPRVFRQACWIGNSTTAATYSAGSADMIVDVQYF